MPSPAAALPGYVERDGDWVWRPPGRLTRVTMHVFVLRAERRALDSLCERFVADPTSRRFQATPLGIALLVCADIGKGWSDHPGDVHKGWMTERDVGFFVPVHLAGPEGGGFVSLLPYLFVDNFAAVVIGREIFGFPKVVAGMRFSEGPLDIEVRGQAIERFATASPVDGHALLVSVREVASRPFVELGDVLRHGRGLAPSIQALTEEANRCVAEKLGIALPRGWLRVPMAFLKQFRGVARPDRACISQLVRADASIDELRSLRLLSSDFEVELPRYDSLDVVAGLGLTPRPATRIVEPAVAMRADLDFQLPAGRVLWP